MIANVLAFVFYMISIYYAFIGVYGLLLNRKQTLNKIYFTISISLAIWAISFAISNTLTNYNSVLFWRRFAALGWGTFFSLITHFFLILTKKHKKNLSLWTLAGLYVPSMIIVFVFGMNSATALDQFQLVQTSSGWGNVLPNNGWDLFYNIYYIGFTCVTIFLLLLWRKQTSNSLLKKDPIYIMWSVVVAIGIGSFTEMMLNNYFTIKIPSIAPIIILIPVTLLLYVIKKERLLLPNREAHINDHSLFVDKQAYKVFFNYVSGFYVIGSIFIIIYYLYYRLNPMHLAAMSTLIVVLGLVIYSVPKLGKSTEFEMDILTLVMVFTVPILLFTFLTSYSSNILWPMPILFLMITIIFNRRKMYTLIAVVSLLTLLANWILMPNELVIVDSFDYVTRLIIYILGIVLAYYINKTYTTKLLENRHQMKFHQIVSSISASFVNVSEHNLDTLIEDMLKKISDTIGADRAYVGILTDDIHIVTFRNEWISKNNRSVMQTLKNINVSDFQWSSNQLFKNQIVFVESVEKLPKAADAEKQMMTSSGIVSFLYIPILVKNVPVGFIGYDKIQTDKNWVIYNYELLKVNSSILSGAMTKVKNEKEMHNLAFLDVLTRLPNRSLLNNRLNEAIAYAKLEQTHVGILFIDLDGFKAVNDLLGHNWGDELLVIVSQRLRASVRSSDTVARFGGDEFIVMIPDISQISYMNEVASNVISVFDDPISINNQEFHITASSGIAVYPYDGQVADTLLKNADLAMYKAKSNGKNQYAWCTEEMKLNISNKMKLTNALYFALENKELHLVYQPQVCLQTLKIVGLEALIRWNHPEFGLVMPSIFIQIAEETGLIHKIGDWIIDEACRQSHVWQTLGLSPIRMAINISVEQFKSGDLFQTINQALEDHALKPKHFELEITEGIAMQESEQIKLTLNALKKLGATISIDDFGTEYSSFNRLQTLPIDRLKIDMQFIRSIGINPQDEALIKVMIYLAKSLGLSVVAEGVETKEQSDFLKINNCQEVQGYYYFKPMAADAVTEILLNQNS